MIMIIWKVIKEKVIWDSCRIYKGDEMLRGDSVNRNHFQEHWSRIYIIYKQARVKNILDGRRDSEMPYNAKDGKNYE